MNTLKRRHFLQFAASTLATLGLSQLDFLTQANRAARVLAQPTGRKLALLIGINNYPSGLNPLKGCLTDVEMQYELLRYCYGLQAIARGCGLRRGEPITFDGKTRSANDSEDSIVQATSSLVRDITRAGGGIAPVGATRGLDPKQSGVFSAILRVVD